MANKSSRKRQKKETEGEVATRVSEMKEGISQMESFMKEAAALAAAEVERIDEIRGNLEGTLACLEAELREKEEMLQQRNAALEDLEKGFMARAQDMEILIQRRDDLLEKRETEFKEALNKQKKQTAMLEAQLGEKEEQLSQKDSAYRESQEGLGARISDLEGEIRRKGELLESREAEIADLQSRINALAVSSEGDGQRRERNTAVVEEVERGLEDGSYLDDPSEEEAEDFEPGVREESKVRLIGQSMRDVVVKPGGVARRGPVPDVRKSRFLSLLAPIKKGS
ncbi:MAG: hypothetical protein AAB154_03355 [Candidatus Binatota bacterium]